MPRSNGTHKVCSKCRRRKLNAEFNANKETLDRLQSWCRQCVSTAQAACVAKRKLLRMPSYAVREWQRLRLILLTHYSGGTPKCSCCGEAHMEFLSLDHIEGGGAAHRKRLGSNQMVFRELRRLGFPPGYRVLCHNCNQAIGAYGYCPHQRYKRKKTRCLVSS